MFCFVLFFPEQNLVSSFVYVKKLKTKKVHVKMYYFLSSIFDLYQVYAPGTPAFLSSFSFLFNFDFFVCL